MTSQRPDYEHEHAPTYNDGRATAIALLCAVLINVGIVGLFLFITWFTYATG